MEMVPPKLIVHEGLCINLNAIQYARFLETSEGTPEIRDSGWGATLFIGYIGYGEDEYQGFDGDVAEWWWKRIQEEAAS